MLFKKITMHGFKSFADPVTIDLDSGITCIVGPNGSGKSNISDAIRWVLGEQSPKMLRGGKMDEIIFAGTDTRKSRGMAEVTLVIDNGDRSLPIDFTEVSITRRMYRTGESEYYINNSQCRLRDIRELIMDTGIGVDGYSIIGQGKISEIINGRPETRKEIFEEAAGIVKYRTKKAETERKLEVTAGNLTRVNDIISELEGRVGPLREESRKAKEYLEISKNYRENEINVILRNIELTDSQNEILRRDLEDTEKHIGEAEDKISGIDSMIRKNKARSDELDLEDQQERERLMNAAYELNDLKNQLRLNAERIESLKKSRNIFGDEVKTLTERIAREDTEKKALERHREELTTQYSGVESQLSDIQKKLSEEEDLVSEKNSEFEEYRNSLYELSMRSSSRKAELNGLESIMRSLSARRESLLEDQEDTEGNDQLSAEVLEKKRRAEDAERKKVEADEFLSSVKKKLFELSEKTEELQKEHARVQSELQKEQTRKDMLQQLEDSYEGYNYAVRFIMNESRISGIYGTVGSLIKAPRGYEIAVETALGARLQNIICEDDESARKAITQLKVRKIGRLTFLPLTSLRVNPRKDDAQLSGEQGYVGIAADIVEFNSNYRNAVEQLLGGTVIVKDLEDALAMSKRHRGYRYVTLEGELINPSGAVTGGAYKNNNAGGLLERKNRLNASDKVIYDLEQELRKAERALIMARDAQESERVNLVQAETDLHNCDIEAVQLGKEYDAILDKSNDANERRQRRASELKRLEAELEHTRELIAEATAERYNIDIRIEDIKRRTEVIADNRDDLNSSVEHLREQMIKVQIGSESLRGELRNVEEQLRRSQISFDDLSREMENKNNSIKENIAEQENIEFRISGIKQEIDTSELKNRDQNGRLNDIKNEKADLSKAYDGLLSDKESADKVLDSHRNRKYDIEVKLRSGETRVDDWKNKIWDEFEISYLEALDIKHPAFDLNEGVKQSRNMRRELRELGDVNVSAIAEYEEVKKRYDFLTEQSRDLTDASATLRSIITETDNLIRSNFEVTFRQIGRNFKLVFKELFGGGDAEIRIDQDVDPLEADIDIVAQPPGKKLQNMNLLSGGEKTMTAIALMFAVLRTKPTPFCILDEIEAALDEANIDRFADYLKNLQNIQFVLVTHSKVTMEHANVLYGVTMPERGISKVLSLKLADAENIEGVS